MRSALAALLVVLVCLPALAAPVTAVDAYVTVSGTTVSPTNPAPGDLLTVTATVQNLQQSSSTLDLREVRLMRDGSRIDSAPNLGTLAPGSSLSVPLTTTFDSPGVKHLTVVATGYDEDADEVTVRYPVVVTVQRDQPRLELAASDPVANAETPVNVTVANGLSEGISNVDVSLRGDVAVRNAERVRATIAAGETAAFGFDAVADAPGDRRVVAALNYTTAGGTRRSVTRARTLTFDPLRERVAIEASRAGTGSSLDVTLTNLGNTPVENVTVTGRADGVVARALLNRVASHGSRTVRLNASAVNGTREVTVEATYDVGTRTGRQTTTATVSANPGRITLTGLDVETESGKLHITGSASNVGLSRADSVVVRVRSSPGVEPAYPGREYFVGSVPASDFVTFDVYARAAPNATSVPVEVSYLVDGTRHRRVFDVPVESSPDPSPDSGGGGGGLLVPALVGLVVTAVVGAIIVVAWRNSRGGD